LLPTDIKFYKYLDLRGWCYCLTVIDDDEMLDSGISFARFGSSFSSGKVWLGVWILGEDIKTALEKPYVASYIPPPKEWAPQHSA
jgi:hypothetical protein